MRPVPDRPPTVSERPPIVACGVIRRVHTAGRLYEVEMANGHRAIAVVPKEGPFPGDGGDRIGCGVTTAFSPFDMSQCRIVRWEPPANGESPGTA